MDKICRICLEEGVLTSIFIKTAYNVSAREMIEYCCNIKVYENDGLPRQICKNCVYKLDMAYHFKQTCERSDIHMREQLGLILYKRLKDANIQTDPMAVQKTILIKRCRKCRPDIRKQYISLKKKPEKEKLRPGPKPKPKPIHKCLQCQKEFRCQAQLELHIRTHTGDKPFACQFCPKHFAQKHNLTIHLRTHTGEKPFQCEICSKTFATQGNLICHIKVHTGQKDHVCQICNKAFVKSNELNRHMSIHTGFKNFKCEGCDKRYSTKRSYRNHKISKHGWQPNETQEQKDVSYKHSVFGETLNVLNEDVKCNPSKS